MSNKNFFFYLLTDFWEADFKFIIYFKVLYLNPELFVKKLVIKHYEREKGES